LILLTALLAGLLAGVMSARWQKHSWTLPPLHSLWLVIIAFLPQFLALYLPVTRARIPDNLAAVGLVLSQVLLLVFCWLNRRVRGIWLLALGTALNMLVIAANGGFMPISPQTAGRLVSPEILQSIPVGSRFGYKDILLLPAQTHLIWLSDVLLPPDWFPYQIAFSLGDICIAAGVFWLTAMGRAPSNTV
jgi:hypothetical protein